MDLMDAVIETPRGRRLAQLLSSKQGGFSLF